MAKKLYLKSITKRFRFYKDLGDKTFEQLHEGDFDFVPAEECNSIGIIIQHLSGNMLSRWTDFLTTDGEKEWRQRDAEFEKSGLIKEQLINLRCTPEFEPTAAQTDPRWPQAGRGAGRPGRGLRASSVPTLLRTRRSWGW